MTTLNDNLPDHVVIVGVGLLGASLGLALRKQGYTGTLVGVGRSHDSLDQAVASGAIDRGTTDLAEASKHAGMIVLAVPLLGFDDAFKTMAPIVQGRLDREEDVVITDVGSTKTCVQVGAEQYLGEAARRFVGSHPMAGSEKSGPSAGDAALFNGKPCIVCPTPGSDLDAVHTVKALWSGLGMNLITMTAEEHDRHVAITSHVPHASSVALIHAAQQFASLDTASTGFADTTRLAGSNPPMRADIMQCNRGAIIDALEAYIVELEAIKLTLLNDDRGALLDKLEEARTLRDAWWHQRTELA